MADDGKKVDFKHPGGKEALIAGGVALGLALLYFWIKGRQQSAAAANQQASTGVNSPTALLFSWIRDHQSSSTTTVTVPNVVGLNDTAADAAIKAVGLAVRDANEPTGGFGKATATVMSQSPAGGASVAPGSVVTLTFKVTQPAPRGQRSPAQPVAKGGGDSGEG